MTTHTIAPHLTRAQTDFMALTAPEERLSDDELGRIAYEAMGGAWFGQDNEPEQIAEALGLSDDQDPDDYYSTMIPWEAFRDRGWHMVFEDKPAADDFVRVAIAVRNAIATAGQMAATETEGE